MNELAPSSGFPPQPQVGFPSAPRPHIETQAGFPVVGFDPAPRPVVERRTDFPPQPQVGFPSAPRPHIETQAGFPTSFTPPTPESTIPEPDQPLRTREQQALYYQRKQGQIHRITQNLISRALDVKKNYDIPNTRSDVLTATPQRLTWSRTGVDGDSIATHTAHIDPYPSSELKHAHKNIIEKATVSTNVVAGGPNSSHKRVEVGQDRYGLNSTQLDGRVSSKGDNPLEPTKVTQIDYGTSQRAAANTLAKLRGAIAGREKQQAAAREARANPPQSPPPSIDEILDF